MKRIIPIIQQVSDRNQPAWKTIKEIDDKLEELGFDTKEINISKPWGGYITFHAKDTEAFIEAFYENSDLNVEKYHNLSPKLLIVRPNAELSWQYHNRRREIWRFLTPGLFVISDNLDNKQKANKDHILYIDNKEKHKLIGHNDKSTIVAELWDHDNPDDLSDEDDIIRIKDIYGRSDKSIKKKGKDMKVVILAGGEGTRLWPVSTYEKPKQFMKLVDNDRSVLRSTYDRLSKQYSDIYVIAQHKQTTFVKDQVPELKDDHIITIPKNKDTALGILIALDYLRRHGAGEDDVISFVPSDHHITEEDNFNKTLYKAAETSKDSKSITLIGLKITHPATQFGYIEKREVSGRDHYDVVSFKEKPNHETALEYQKSGKYYWNGGMFVAPLGVFSETIHKFSPAMSHNHKKLAEVDEIYSDEYLSVYDSLEGRSIDYDLIERVENLKMVEATFSWMDVGSFKQIHNLSEKDENDNYYNPLKHHLLDVKDSYIRSDSDKPIAVIGLKNIVVVETEDGILVADLSVSEEAGKISKMLQKKKTKKSKK